MSTLHPTTTPLPTRTQPLVVATLIFMSGLFAIVLLLVLVTRGDAGAGAAGAGASDATAHVHTAAATAPTEANPTPAATVVGPSHHTPAATAVTDTHAPYPAELPPLVPGVKQVKLALQDVDLQIAPGVTFHSWTFAGGAPGPVIHVRQGQRVHVEAHEQRRHPALDRLPRRPDRAEPRLRTSSPARRSRSSFTAGDPGVFMYHCGTPPVLAPHRERHVRRDRRRAEGRLAAEGQPLVRARRERVVPERRRREAPAGLDMAKARHMHARLRDLERLRRAVQDASAAREDLGENVRFFVVAAGPSFDTAFHVVGTLLDRAWTGTAGIPGHVLNGAQTVVRARRWRRRLRRPLRREWPVPVRVPLVRLGGHGPGRPGQRRQRAGHDQPLSPFAGAGRPAGRPALATPADGQPGVPPPRDRASGASGEDPSRRRPSRGSACSTSPCT